jgi:hypothetical protein
MMEMDLYPIYINILCNGIPNSTNDIDNQIFGNRLLLIISIYQIHSNPNTNGNISNILMQI